MFALFYKGKSANKMYFSSAYWMIFLEWREFLSCDWLRADKSHLVVVGMVQIHCRTGLAACPTAVLLTIPCLLSSVTSVRHVCPSRLPSHLSVMSVPCVCWSCPSLTSICHVCPSLLSITSVCHFCPSHLSVTSVHHICPSHLSVTSVCHVCLSRLSVMSVK